MESCWVRQSNSGVSVTGRVVSGKGEGFFFTQLDWVRDQCVKLLGFYPFPGTFNVKLNPRDSWVVEQCRTGAGITLQPPSRVFCQAKAYEARINGLVGAVVHPLVEDYPPDLLELFFPVSVRATLGVNDGDWVTVTIYFT